MEHESDCDTNCNWGTRYSLQIMVPWLENLEIRERVETIQTTALLNSARLQRKGHRDLKRLAVTQTSVERN